MPTFPFSAGDAHLFLPSPGFASKSPDFPYISVLIIIITNPDNRHYENHDKRYNQHITCLLVHFYNKSKLNMKPVVVKKGANKQLCFEIFARDSRKILVGPKCPYYTCCKISAMLPYPTAHKINNFT